MNIKILAAVILLLAGCVPPPARPYSSGPGPYGAPSSSSSDSGQSTTTRSRDVSDCERQAALSTAGSKAEAFNNCMKAKRGAN